MTLQFGVSSSLKTNAIRESRISVQSIRPVSSNLENVQAAACPMKAPGVAKLPQALSIKRTSADKTHYEIVVVDLTMRNTILTVLDLPGLVLADQSTAED